MNSKILINIVLSLLLLPLFVFFAPFVLTALYFFLFTFFLITKKNDLMKDFLLASLFGLVWLVLARNLHNPFPFLTLFNVNVSPFFSWSLALFLAYLLSKKLFQSSFSVFFLIFFYAIAPIIGCFSFMAIPLCTCTHSPFWLKISYLWMGPLYLIALHLIHKKSI